MKVSIQLADLNLPEHGTAVVQMLDHYARHPMGSGQPLPMEVKSKLVEGLRAHPMSRVFLAWCGNQVIGIVTCFVGFSTFKAKSLINIHDLCVHQDFQGQGIGSQLIDTIIDYARELDCCAVTLEVRCDNRARKLYHQKGFQSLAEPLAENATLFGKLML